jgi:hypothetical protein
VASSTNRSYSIQRGASARGRTDRLNRRVRRCLRATALSDEDIA